MHTNLLVPRYSWIGKINFFSFRKVTNVLGKITSVLYKITNILDKVTNTDNSIQYTGNFAQNTGNFAQNASKYIKIHKIYHFASPPLSCLRVLYDL